METFQQVFSANSVIAEHFITPPMFEDCLDQSVFSRLPAPVTGTEQKYYMCKACHFVFNDLKALNKHWSKYGKNHSGSGHVSSVVLPVNARYITLEHGDVCKRNVSAGKATLSYLVSNEAVYLNDLQERFPHDETEETDEDDEEELEEKHILQCTSDKVIDYSSLSRQERGRHTRNPGIYVSLSFMYVYDSSLFLSFSLSLSPLISLSLMC